LIQRGKKKEKLPGEGGLPGSLRGVKKVKNTFILYITQTELFARAGRKKYFKLFFMAL